MVNKRNNNSLNEDTESKKRKTHSEKSSEQLIVRADNIIELIRQSTDDSINQFNELAEQLIQVLLENSQTSFSTTFTKQLGTKLAPFISHICEYLTGIDLLIHPPYHVCQSWNQALRTNFEYWDPILNGIGANFKTELNNCKAIELYGREKLQAWSLHRKCGPVRYIEGELVPMDRGSWDNDDYSPLDSLNIVTLGEENYQRSSLVNQVFIIDYNKKSSMKLDYITTDEQVPANNTVFDNYCGYWFSKRTPKWFLFQINYSRFEEEDRSIEYTCIVTLYKTLNDFNSRKNGLTLVKGMNTSLKNSTELLERWLLFDRVSRKDCEKFISNILSEIMPLNSWKDYSKVWKFDGEFVFRKKKKKLNIEEGENGFFTI